MTATIITVVVTSLAYNVIKDIIKGRIKKCLYSQE